MMTPAISKFWLLLAVISVCQCAGQQPYSQAPTDRGPGQCPINCSKTFIAAADSGVFQIQNVNKDTTVTCNAPGQILTFDIIWRVVQKFKSNNVDSFRPVPFVSFRVIGGTINTDPDLFCSDSCGVMTVNVSLSCPTISGSSIAYPLFPQSGALFPETPIVITLVTQ